MTFTHVFTKANWHIKKIGRLTREKKLLHSITQRMAIALITGNRFLITTVAIIITTKLTYMVMLKVNLADISITY